jgi:protein-S-isoprenylcysteine O-methyltransferase Ste14
MKIITLLFCWIIYFAVHSILANDGVKSKIYHKLPTFKKYYRLCYNFIAIIFLLPISYFSITELGHLIVENKILKYLGFIFLCIGTILLFASFSSFNLKEFFGIEQYQEKEEKEEKGKLVISGMYQYVRHPLYFSIIIIFLGILCIFPSIKILCINTIVYLYLMIGSKLEEKKLIAYFGEEYINYSNKVKGLVPYLY